MMKKKLLFSLLLLFAGVSMQAQSIATEQMDERFNDDKMPYGWFAEGWEVDDGKAKAKAIVDSGNNGFPGMGGNPGTSGNPGMGDFPGMGSMFGGDHIRTYMLTPPVVVKDGEDMVFSVRKPKPEGGFSFDMKAIMGMSDTIFVVERSEYGKNQWLRVGDFTTTVNDDPQTFTVSGTPKGEYRFRFVSYVEVEIDSVAGFHIDKEAPDLLVTVDSLHTHFVDFSVCDQDSTKEFIVINTGTGTLKVNIKSSDESLFSVADSQLSIAAGDSAKVNVTFHYAAGEIGKNEALLTFTPADDRVVATEITVAAVITEPGVWFVDFNDNKLPFGCYGEGFVVKDSVATHHNPDGGGMAAMAAIFGGGGASDWFMTPPLTIQNENNAIVFSLKNGDGSYKGPIFDPQANVTIEKTVYGSNKWERVDAYQFKDTLYHTKWISWLPAGDYRFRFVSGDSLCIDSIAGGFIRMDAPDLLVRHNGHAVQSVNFGIVRDSFTKTFQLINTGTAPLQLYAMSSDPSLYTLSEQMFDIAPGESASVDVTFHYDANALGAHQAALVLTPTNCDIAMQMIYLSAYITYEDAWSEDFEPEFLVEEGETVELPEGWSTTGWQVIKGGGMDMMAMMGMGGGAEKTYAPHTDSDAYELITPRLQGQKGDVLRFYADISMGWLNVEYKRDDDMDWTYYNTYVNADSVYFIAPLSGVYQLRFTGSSVAVDDFLGFRTPLEEIAIYEGKDNSAVLQQYAGKTVNVKYDRVLSAVDNGDGTWKRMAYTVCLPYKFNIQEYVENGSINVYSLYCVDNYYNEFIFTNEFSILMPGIAYLVVVNEGSVNLSASGVTIEETPFVSDTDQRSVVYDYKSVRDNNPKMVGHWRGTFENLSNSDLTAMSAYILQSDGQMKLVLDDTEDHRKAHLSPFRCFFEPQDHKPLGARNCPLRYVLTENGEETGEVTDFPADLFEGDGDETTTGIDMPVIHTIDSDGTHRYYDLQGHQLDGSPRTGIYIKDGKKYSNK